MSSATDAVSPSAKMHLDSDGSQMDVGGSSPAESQPESVGSVPESSSSEDFAHSDNSAAQSSSESTSCLGSSRGSSNGTLDAGLFSVTSTSGISSQSNNGPPSKRSRLDNTDEPADSLQMEVNNDAPAEAQPEPLAQELDPMNRSSAALSNNSVPISSNHTSSGSHPADGSSMPISEPALSTGVSSRPGSSTSTGGHSSLDSADMCLINENSLEFEAANGGPGSANGPSNEGVNSSNSNSRPESSIPSGEPLPTSRESSRPGSEALIAGPSNRVDSRSEESPMPTSEPRSASSSSHAESETSGQAENEGANSSSGSPARPFNLPAPHEPFESNESSMSTDDGRRYLPLGKRAKPSTSELPCFSGTDESDSGMGSRDVNGPEFEQAPPGASCRRDGHPSPPSSGGGVC